MVVSAARLDLGNHGPVTFSRRLSHYRIRDLEYINANAFLPKVDAANSPR